MIDPIIDYLNALIAPLGFSTHGVTTLLERDGVTFPGVYYREGESLAINQETDHVYHRITARTQSREPDSSPVGGEDLLVKSFSMRCVASFTRGMVADTGDEEQDVAGNLETILNSQNLKTLADQIGYISIAVTSENIETGREVWETELDGIEYDMSRGFCAVEYEVQIRAQESCFTAQACGEEVDIVQVIQDQYCGDSCEDVTIESSGGAFSASAISGTTYTIQDIYWQDSDGSEQTIEYNNSGSGSPLITATACGDALPRFLKTAVTTSYRTGDEADIGAGYLTSWLVLPSNNAFGNTIRFTNDQGGTVWDGSDGSTADYAIDHATGLGWYLLSAAGAPWNDQIDAALALTVGPYSDFHLPSRREVVTIANESLSDVKDYAPFNAWTGVLFWTSTTNRSTTTQALYLYSTTPTYLGTNGKTVNYRGLAVRQHYP